MLKIVDVQIGDESLTGSLHKDELSIPNQVKKMGNSIKVEGKERHILSSIVDYRDNIVKINLAKASEPKKEKKSDGKSTKG